MNLNKIKSNIIPIIFGIIILAWVGIALANKSEPECDSRCQATIEVQNMITKAQLDYLAKKSEYDREQQEAEQAEQEKDIAKQELDRLFQQNRELLESGDTDISIWTWDFTKSLPQGQKLGLTWTND